LEQRCDRATHSTGRLKADGFTCCFISLSDIGSEGTEEQWYFTLADKIARKLRISGDISTWWNGYSLLSPLGRFSHFIETIILEEIKQNIVIFIDEIDSVRRLKFSADDFFALLRACYNNRVEQSKYERLTFTLLGVATPSALIQDRNCTPFNIGKGIYLKGFKLDEALPLVKGLQEKSSHPEVILKEVLSTYKLIR
jgi:AAA-like domain